MSVERIDAARCNGCRMCVDACPLDIFRLDTLVEERGESPPCRVACPAGVDMRTYIYFLMQGMVEEAIRVLRESLPLPAVTGRVCPHPCETECARRQVDEAVNINSLERFVADHWLKEKAQPVRRIYASMTAVVGSGPAGLSCAYFLNRMGYPVTVFEAMPAIGGMLRLAIPEYRLPRDVLDAQIDYIRDMGVEFKTGVTIGRELTVEGLKKEYQAVFLAVGNQLSRKLELEGVGLDGVLWGLDFLRQVKLQPDVKVNDRVVVVGGGNVAINVALSALRLGAKDVQVVCLEPEGGMPAYEEEVKQAIEEGVAINDSWGPKRILGDGTHVTGIELVRCTRVVDEKGDFNPSFDERETRTMEADMIILAVGQAPNVSLLPEGIKTTERGAILIDPVTLETSLPGVFAGGDAAAEVSSVVDAIAAGRKASVSIDRYLKGEDLKAGRGAGPRSVPKPPREGIREMTRQVPPLLDVAGRAGNFDEVAKGLDQWTAFVEAQRCMTCGGRAVIAYPEHCMLCLFCERDCPVNAVYVSPEKRVQPLFAWE